MLSPLMTHMFRWASLLSISKTPALRSVMSLSNRSKRAWISAPSSVSPGFTAEAVLFVSITRAATSRIISCGFHCLGERALFGGILGLDGCRPVREIAVVRIYPLCLFKEVSREFRVVRNMRPRK